MKKILFLISIIVISTMTISAQIDISLGMTGFALNTKSSSKIGFNMGLTINHFYCDFSNNFASGKGEELDFSSSNTYKADKLSVGIINVGYNINVFPSNTWYITPLIGYGYARDIYEDPVGFDTYFYGKTKSYFNFGVITKVYLNKFGIFGGIGTFEKFKFGLAYKFN